MRWRKPPRFSLAGFVSNPILRDPGCHLPQISSPRTIDPESTEDTFIHRSKKPDEKEEAQCATQFWKLRKSMA